MADLLSQVVMLNLDDVNDIDVEHFGDGKYALRIGDNMIVCKCYEDLKTICLNIQSAFEKLLKLKLDDCRTPEETISAVNDNFKSILKVYGGAK